MADFILRLGVSFSPRDVDTKKIRQQIAKAIGAATVSIERVSFSRAAKEKLKSSFAGIAFSIQKARFATDARRALQTGFGTIRFGIQRALFGRTGRSDLQASFKRIPFTVASVQIASAAVRQLQNQLSNIQVRTSARSSGDSLANKARKEFEQRQRPATLGAKDLNQIDPKRIRNIANEFRNLGTATAQLSGVGRQVRALRNVSSTFLDISGRSETLSRNLRSVASRLADVQSRAGETRAALAQMQLARRAAEVKALAIQHLKLVQAEDSTTRSTRQLANVLRQGGLSAEVFGARLGQITARFGQYLISVRAIIAAQQLFSASLDSIVRFDTVIQNLNQVLNTTPTELAKVSEGLFKVAQDTARSFDEVSEAVAIFVRAGDTIPESLEKAQAALIATNISELGAADATRLITSALQVFGKELQDPIEFLDKLSITADNAATTAGAVGQAFLRSASAARESGVGFEQLLGIIASTLEETQLQAGTVGTALKTIFTRAISNAEGLREVGNQFGANIREGDDLITTLGKLAAIFDETSIAQRNQIGLLVGGRRQFNIFAGILNNFNKSQELVALQADASGTALRKNEEQLQTLAAQGRSVIATFDKLVNSIAGTTEGADGAGKLRGVMSQVLTTTDTLLQVVVDLAGRFSQAGAIVQTITGALKGAVVAGLLAVGGRIIAGLVNGFRQFLQVGGLISGILERLGGQVNKIETEERQVNTQLMIQRDLRLQNAQLAGQTAGAVGAGGIVGQGSAVVAPTTVQNSGGRRGFFGRSLDRLTGSLNSLRDNLRRPAGGFFSGQDVGEDRRAQVAGARRLAGIVALGAVANVASTNITALADSVRAGKTANDAFAAAGLDATASAVQIGVTFGALTGSLKFGLLAGLIAAGGALIKFAKQEEENAKAALKFQEALASAGNFSVQQAREGFGGDVLKDAVEALAGNLDELDGDKLFNLENIILRSGDLIAKAGQTLSSALDQSKDAIEDFGDRITAFGAQSQFRRDIAQGEREVRAGQIQADFELKGLTGLEGITGPLSEALAISEQITRGLDRGTSSGLRLAEAFAAGRDLLELQGVTIQDIISDFDLETESRARAGIEAENLLADLEKEQRQLGQIVDEQDKFTAALQRSIDKVAKLEAAAKKVAEAGGALVSGNKSVIGDDIESATSGIPLVGGLVGAANIAANAEREDNITSELVKQAELKKELVARTQQQESLEKNIQTLREEQTRVTQILRREDDNILEGLKEIQKRFQDITKQSGESAKSARKETAEILDRNSGLKRQAEIQATLLQSEKDRGTALQQFEARQAATLGAANAVVDQQLEEAKRNIENLRALAKEIQLSSPDVAKSLNDAASDLAKAVSGQEGALKAEVELRLRPQLERQIFEELKKNEAQLSSIRLEAIDQAIDKETRRFQQQQQLLQGLDTFIKGIESQGGGTSGGSSVRRLRSQINEELQGISQDARDVFGDIGAILIRNTLQSFETIARKSKDILDEIANVRDPVQRQRKAASLEQQIIERNEEAIQFIREKVLSELKASADRATGAEELLKNARDKVTEATGKVKSAEDGVAAASERVAQAQQRLSAATQGLSNAQVDYNISLVAARNNVLSATGAFRSFADQITALSAISAAATSIVGVSEEKILEIRARVAQEAIQIFQNQFDAIQSLGSQAATATLSEFTDLQTGLAAAQQVLAGNGGELPPELLQLASQFTDLFPGLERAIAEIGLERLGVDPGVLEEIQDRQLQLAEITADSTKSSVVQAEKQVAIAFEQLGETREGKAIAKEQLASAREQESRAKENLEVVRRGSAVASAGFARQASLASNQLSQLAGSFVLGQRSLELLNASRNLQQEAVNELIELNGRLANQRSVTTLTADQIANQASGSLSQSEINGLLAAAQREKRGMPGGSRLMLANTSETVLTRTQARGMGLRPNAQAFAQDGNAIGTGELSQLATAVMQTVAELRSAITGGTLVQQTIQVQIDQNRTVDIRGVDQIDQILRTALEGQFGGAATRVEQDALRQIIVGVVERLNESGIVNSRGF